VRCQLVGQRWQAPGRKGGIGALHGTSKGTLADLALILPAAGARGEHVGVVIHDVALSVGVVRLRCGRYFRP
jgi:hypothetical protein